jgi:hypothetical protein
MKNGDFSNVPNKPTIVIRDPYNDRAPFPNNQIPKTRFSISSSMLQFFPDPNQPLSGNLNYITTPPDRERRDQFTARIDHRVSDRGQPLWTLGFADDALTDALPPGKGVIRRTVPRTPRLATPTPSEESHQRIGLGLQSVSRASQRW